MAEYPVVWPAQPQVAKGPVRLTASNRGYPGADGGGGVSGEQELQPRNFFLYKQAFYVKLFIPIFIYNDLCPEEKTNISGVKRTAESSF